MKLIVAFDFSSPVEALALAKKLDPHHCAIKVGSEMFTRFGAGFLQTLIQDGFKVFLDLKFHDIPNTVAQACIACADLGVWMINVHASGGLAMMQAARTALSGFGENRPLLIAVTILTSIRETDLPLIGINASLDEQVKMLAKLAYQANLDGVVCSAFEVPLIKAACSSSFLTVTPGIRLSGDSLHDQARVMTPAKAKAIGSDFLVVGRSITQAADPAEVVRSILAGSED